MFKFQFTTVNVAKNYAAQQIIHTILLCMLCKIQPKFFMRLCIQIKNLINAIFKWKYVIVYRNNTPQFQTFLKILSDIRHRERRADKKKSHKHF